MSFDYDKDGNHLITATEFLSRVVAVLEDEGTPKHAIVQSMITGIICISKELDVSDDDIIKTVKEELIDYKDNFSSMHNVVKVLNSLDLDGEIQ